MVAHLPSHYFLILAIICSATCKGNSSNEYINSYN